MKTMHENSSFSLLQLDEEFGALADKAPPTIRRKSNADRMYGTGPMPKSSHVSFD